MRLFHVIAAVGLIGQIALCDSARAAPGAKVACPAVIAFKDDGTYIKKQGLVCYKSAKGAEKDGYIPKSSQDSGTSFPLTFSTNGPATSKLFKLPVGIYTFSWQFDGGRISDTSCIVRLYDVNRGYIDNATATRYDGETGAKKIGINTSLQKAYMLYECSYDLPVSVTVTKDE